MKPIVIVLLVVFAAANAQFSEWQKFKARHKKTYLSAEHESRRRTIFMENLKMIRKHNFEADLKMHSWYLGINKLADMTNEEVSQKMTGLKKMPTFPQDNSNDVDLGNLKVSDSKNWVEEGYVTAPSDQGDCGSCYAFSATATIEGQYKKITGNLLKFSEQSVMDCTKDDKYNFGCSGGFVDQCFTYVKKSGGMMLADDDPYKQEELKCGFEKAKAVNFTVLYTSIYTRQSETRIKGICNMGPISAAMSTKGEGYNLYKRGIYCPSRCPKSVNHSINIVGYGSNAKGKKYWLIKNSWGTGWGLDGYMKLLRDECKCGICTQINYLGLKK